MTTESALLAREVDFSPLFTTAVTNESTLGIEFGDPVYWDERRQVVTKNPNATQETH